MVESRSVPLRRLVVPFVRKARTLRMQYVVFALLQFAFPTMSLFAYPIDALSLDHVIYNVKIYFIFVQFYSKIEIKKSFLFLLLRATFYYEIKVLKIFNFVL